MTDKNLHVMMAGSGRPYDALTPRRIEIIRALHHGLEPLDLEAEIGPLLEANLVCFDDGRYLPTFFVATHEEAERTVAHAETVGLALARCIQDHWSSIKATFEVIRPTPGTALRQYAFLLVGARILDIGLLAALSRDAALMPPPPHRPSPLNPEARYYFWMFDGPARWKGRYGQRGLDIPWKGWSLLTFGEYENEESLNAARDAFEEEATAITSVLSSPHALADALQVPLYDGAAVHLWWLVARECGTRLLDVYRAHEADLREFYATLEAKRYLPDGFGEFFCWYHHLAYAAAIDRLAARDLLIIPAPRFAAAVWGGPPSF